jgi:hypothetical protein
MSESSLGYLFLLIVLVGMVSLMVFGRRVGEKHLARDPQTAKMGLGTVDGAVFALMGLMLAFTFSGASSRFDSRRVMVIEEANCIGTAWLRLDLLPATAQPPLREKLRDYTAARLATFSKLPDIEAARVELSRANALQTAIWNQAVPACRDSSSPNAALLLLPALNQMFDAAATRTRMAQLHPPLLIYVLLLLLVLASTLLAGYNFGIGKVRTWVHSIAFMLTIVCAVYVILDFEFPRAGVIRIHAMDQVFVDLLNSMKP